MQLSDKNLPRKQLKEMQHIIVTFCCYSSAAYRTPDLPCVPHPSAGKYPGSRDNLLACKFTKRFFFDFQISHHIIGG